MQLIRRILTAIIVMLAFGVTESLGEMRQFKTLSGRDGLSDILVNTIYKDYQGYIWLGTESAIDRYDGNSIVSYPLTDKSKGMGRVNAILHTKQGDLYIGTTSGLSVMPAGSVLPKRMQADRISMPVNALDHDRSGNIYIATDQGLFKYNTYYGTFIIFRYRIIPCRIGWQMGKYPQNRVRLGLRPVHYQSGYRNHCRGMFQETR